MKGGVACQFYVSNHQATLSGLEAQLLRSDRSRRSCELRKEFSEIGELHADAQPLIALASQGGHDGRIVTSL